jgi:ketosteroid isomerase-like protein
MRRNRGDIAAMMALFTDDAVREDGSCQPPCVGPAAVRKSFQKNIDEHFHANVTTAEGAGDTVTARAEISSDAFRARGIDKRMPPTLSNFAAERSPGGPLPCRHKQRKKIIERDDSG